MPAPGEQHKASNATTNPFEEVQPRISEYTAQEIATLQCRLNKQLGPEYISARAGPGGGRVHYIAAEKCIQLANEVFGFNGWSSSIREVQVDYVEELPQSGKFNMGISVIMRVTLRDGTYHEDIGYGHVENCKSKALGFEKTKKEATTDALKRALRSFGNVLGNCIYDKDFISKVTRIKVAPTKFDVNNLHRHSDHTPVKKEPGSDEGSKASGEPGYSTENYEAEDEFGADFDEIDFGVAENGHPDEVSVDGTVPKRVSPVKNTSNSALHQSPSTTHNIKPLLPNGPNKAPLPDLPAPRTPQQQQATTNLNAAQRPVSVQGPAQANSVKPSRPPQPQPSHQPRPLPPQSHTPNAIAATNTAPARSGLLSHPANEPPRNTGASATMDPAVPVNAPIGFFTAREAETIMAAPAILPDKATFNPHAESPSIPKTAGFDHSRSKPVFATRDIPGNTQQNNGNLQLQLQQHVQTTANSTIAPLAGSRHNFVNPHLDNTRRIGMPGTMAGSPVPNRGSYRIPMKRPGEGSGVPNSAPVQGPPHQRPALAEVTGGNSNVPPLAAAQVIGNPKGEPPEKKQRFNAGSGQIAAGSGAGSVTAS